MLKCYLASGLNTFWYWEEKALLDRVGRLNRKAGQTSRPLSHLIQPIKSWVKVAQTSGSMVDPELLRLLNTKGSRELSHFNSHDVICSWAQHTKPAPRYEQTRQTSTAQEAEIKGCMDTVQYKEN